MTQAEQQAFQCSLDEALYWMQAAQEKLRANDNTQGPRAALENRLRETEKIHEAQHEGRMKMDLALVSADVLLKNGDEELKNQTNAKLKELKALWEDTSTYIIHCHSRIEWVWLHWSEYLKAHEEFQLWLARVRRALDAEVEQQLGLKEKRWQVDAQRVVLSDVQGQATLLERLLDEAAALHGRTQDPSVEPQAQERLQEDYNDVRDRAEERLALLQVMAEEHQTYQDCVRKFQVWLLSKTEELGLLVEKDDAAENRLKALQALDDSVAGEESTLQHIEGMAEAVRSNTSPAGAEAVVEEAEELRLGWQRLRQGLYETGESLRDWLDSHNQYQARCLRLGEDIGRIRALLYGCGHDLEEGREAGERGEMTEEQILDQWRKYSVVRNKLSAEESKVEQLKEQLKELFRFSQDSRYLSDDVLAVVKEHQSVKCRAVRLCSESESGLRQVLQDPLHFYNQWSQTVSQVLESSAEVTEFSHIAMLVQNIERLLQHSVQLQERLAQLQAKQELFDSVFSPERSESLRGEMAAAVRNRELLHNQLLQRRSRLQGLLSRTKDFSSAYETVRCRLNTLQDRISGVDVLQPDILAKKSQLDQLAVIQRDLEECEAQVRALEMLVSSSPTNRSQCEKLHADWNFIYKDLKVKLNECDKNIADHESFHESLLNMQKWLMITRQKLDSYRGPAGEWSIDGRRQEAERLLGEFPEKELQLHRMEAQGCGVLEKTSQEGGVHIQRDLQHLRTSWLELHTLSLNLYRLLNQSPDPDGAGRTQRDGGSSRAGELLSGEGDLAGGGRLEGGGAEPRWTGTGESGDGGKVTRSPLPGPLGSLQPGSDPMVADGSEQPSGAQGLNLSTRSEKIHGRDSEHCRRSEGASQSPEDTLSPHRGVLPISINWKTESAEDIPDSWRGSYLEGGAARMGQGGGQGGAERLGQGGGQGGAERLGQGGAERLGQGGGAFTPVRRESAQLELLKPSSPGGAAVLHGQLTAESRRNEFEAWLSREEELLNRITSKTGAPLGTKEFRIQQDTLKALRAGVGWGQEQFQQLLQKSQMLEAEAPGQGKEDGLEELRYRWMLYKSKLREVGELRARRGAKGVRAKREEQPKAVKQKTPSLLQRVCRVALPLWLLFLALLLLAFLLPLMEAGSSCSLSNNFARSFNIMLRYHGPPPT